MKRLILILLLLGILTAPIASGQHTPSSIDISSYEVKTGETFYINITGDGWVYDVFFKQVTQHDPMEIIMIETNDAGFASLEYVFTGRQIDKTTEFEIFIYEYNDSFSKVMEYQEENILVVYDELQWLRYYKAQSEEWNEKVREWFDQADEYMDEQAQKIDNLIVVLIIFSLIIVLLSLTTYKLRKLIKEQGMEPRIVKVETNPYELIVNMVIYLLALYSIVSSVTHENNIYLVLLIPVSILTVIYIRWYRKKQGEKEP